TTPHDVIDMMERQLSDGNEVQVKAHVSKLALSPVDEEEDQVTPVESERAFANMLRDQTNHVRSCLEKLDVMICEMRRVRSLVATTRCKEKKDNETECQVTVVESIEPCEEVEVKAHVSKLALSPVDEEEAQVTASKSRKPSEDLESQVTGNGTETCENSIKEDENQVSVDVS
nr:hypothetical protein CTI12_AA466230 [Tanacetum cinerariifolium]